MTSRPSLPNSWRSRMNMVSASTRMLVSACAVGPDYKGPAEPAAPVGAGRG